MILSRLACSHQSRVVPLDMQVVRVRRCCAAEIRVLVAIGHPAILPQPQRYERLPACQPLS